jgi:hypothetical protein
MTQASPKPPGAPQRPPGVPLQRPQAVPHGVGNPVASSKQQKPSGFIEIAVEWGFKIITFPFHVVTTIFNSMLQPGAAGATFLGRLTFVFLTVLSSDGYWQLLFRKKALFPFYEESWTGWYWLPGMQINWIPFKVNFYLGILSNPLFYICICIGLMIQLIQSATVNGDKFMGINPRALGMMAIATYAFDIITGFATRNPLRYDNPADVIMCTTYVAFTIVCAELGRYGEKMLSAKK